MAIISLLELLHSLFSLYVMSLFHSQYNDTTPRLLIVLAY